ncbi:DUF86 domain-containing protein [Candidatus Woesearchaeota archaeon]|nr:DUF86 domain-containing protein [Candidatus Woesearchaeota archaeon]
MKKEISDRKKRYKEKIDYARDRISDLEDWLYTEDIKERKTFFASEKSFQEVVECLADIFSMILSDLNLTLNDDYSNIEKLKEKKILSEENAGICIESNGLRNRVVHRYNHIDEKMFIESSKELIPKLAKILDYIEDYLKNSKNGQ